MIEKHSRYAGGAAMVVVLESKEFLKFESEQEFDGVEGSDGGIFKANIYHQNPIKDPPQRSLLWEDLSMWPVFSSFSLH